MHFLKVALFGVLSSCLSIDIAITSPAQRTFLAEDDKTPGALCNCSGVKPISPAEANTVPLVCNDRRLGPVDLLSKLPLLSIVGNYDRFGNLTPGEFLAKWTDKNGRWIYPEQDGWLLDYDGKPIKAPLPLKRGQLVDRFGGENGQYLAAADAPYNQRSLPPENLVPNPKYTVVPDNYYLYEVMREVAVEGGPVAPWFGQPGLGTQFYIGKIYAPLTGITVGKLVEAGYLRRLDPSKVKLGSGKASCGKEGMQICPENFQCRAPR